MSELNNCGEIQFRENININSGLITENRNSNENIKLLDEINKINNFSLLPENLRDQDQKNNAGARNQEKSKGSNAEKKFKEIDSASGKIIRNNKEVKKPNSNNIEDDDEKEEDEFGDITLIHFRDDNLKLDDLDADNDSFLKEENQMEINVTGAEIRASKVREKEKARSKKTVDRDKAKENIKKYHDMLEGAEDSIFGAEVRNLTKTRYASVSAFKKKKRTDEALEREKYAKKIEDTINVRALVNNEGDDPDYITDKETLLSKIKTFMNMRDDEYDLDTDEKFAANLEKNYQLTKYAERMRKYVNDAIEGRFMPDSVDLNKLQKKINSFEELKKYLDVRVRIVTSPFYKYCASQDVAYSDDQLNTFISGFDSKNAKYREDNGEVLEYLKNIKTFRDLKFIRKKGVASVSKITDERGLREAELLRHKAAKQSIVRATAGQSLQISDLRLYSGQNRFTEEKFMSLRREFAATKLSDLHFESFSDMTVYARINEELFERARTMEHMLYLAVSDDHQIDIPRDELHAIRARIRAFDVMEQLYHSVRNEMVRHPDETVENKTYSEIWSSAIDLISSKNVAGNNAVFPEVGANLDKYYRTVLKSFRTGNNAARDDAAIKSSIINDHRTYTRIYDEVITEIRFDSFLEAYGKKRNINARALFVPVNTWKKYMTGKSVAEADRVVKILSSGKEEEKTRLMESVNRSVNAAAVNDGQEIAEDRKESILRDQQPGMERMLNGGLSELIGPVGAGFKERKLTESQRAELLKKEGSELFEKNSDADTIRDKQKEFNRKLFTIKNRITTENRAKVGDKTMDDLAAVMIGNFVESERTTDEMNLFVNGYATDRTAGLDLITRSIMALEIVVPTEFEEASAKMIAGNAGMFEEITRKAYAYRNLMRANPEYLKSLKSRFVGDDEQSDYDKVNEKLNRMFAYSDYYRACKLVLNDNYYILHGNDEIGRSNTRGMNREQRHLYDLMRLVDVCHGRMQDNVTDDRLGEAVFSVEETLDTYEKQSRMQGYRTGRVDLTKATVAHTEEVRKQTEKFLHKIYTGGNIRDDIMEYKPDQDDRVERYRTAGVENYLDAYKTREEMGAYYNRDKGVNFRDPAQQALFDKLYKLVKPGAAEFEIGFDNSFGEEQGEKWKIKTQISRFLGDLIYQWYDKMPEEEMIDLIEGLTIQQRIEIRDKQTFDYARERWLRSAKKLFEIQYETLKNLENTYGTLMADMPTAVFMNSLVDGGMRDLLLRCRIGQNLTEACDMDTCTYNDQKISLGQLLVNEKLLDQSTLDDSKKKQAEFYQIQTLTVNSYLSKADDLFDVTGNKDNDPTLNVSYGYTSYYSLKNAIDKNDIGGPHLNYSDSRKLWKDALSSGKKYLTGTEETSLFAGDFYRLHGSKERNEIKKLRRKGMEFDKQTRVYLRDRSDLLYNKTLTKAHINAEELDADKLTMIKKLMVFHPGFSRFYPDNDQQYIAKTDEFINNIRLFAGVGVADDKLKSSRQQAFEYFRKSAAKLVTDVSARTPDELLKNSRVLQDDAPVLGSEMMKMETCHAMYELLQDMVKYGDELNWFTEDAREKLKKDVFLNLRMEVMRLSISSNFYQNLKDISGRKETELARNYMSLQALGGEKTRFETNNLERCVFSDKGVTKLLKQFGVRLDPFLRDDHH